MVMFFLGLVILFSCTQKLPQKIEWAVSLEDALKIASEKDKPIIAEFWMDG
jgi:hypothetical protein